LSFTKLDPHQTIAVLYPNTNNFVFNQLLTYTLYALRLGLIPVNGIEQSRPYKAEVPEVNMQDVKVTLTLPKSEKSKPMAAEIKVS
jgi:hypothetical protein